MAVVAAKVAIPAVPDISWVSAFREFRPGHRVIRDEVPQFELAPSMVTTRCRMKAVSVQGGWQVISIRRSAFSLLFSGPAP